VRWLTGINKWCATGCYDIIWKSVSNFLPYPIFIYSKPLHVNIHVWTENLTLHSILRYSVALHRFRRPSTGHTWGSCNKQANQAATWGNRILWVAHFTVPLLSFPFFVLFFLCSYTHTRSVCISVHTTTINWQLSKHAMS
jgi:hypothetical protein